MKIILKTAITTIVVVLLVWVAVAVSGCSNKLKVTNETALYWPWENGDDIYKSREAENTWGHGTLR